MHELKIMPKIEEMIYEIRGKQVMLDSDLAKLYKCTNGTKDINKAVRRNIEKFPKDFYFQLTNEEYNSLRFQFGTLKNGRGEHKKYLPYVFTEQGISMLASVLHTSNAIKMSVNIIRAFVLMRHYISDNLLEQKHINNIVLEDHSTLLEHDNDIKLLQESFQKLEEKRKINEIYFNGQIYDAYSKILDIFNSSKKELIIIDSYADKKLLDIIKNLNIKITLITTDKYIKKEIIKEYNKQYNNLKVIYNNDFHDRYFIIDNIDIYHCGASINRIGYKTFSINIIEDKFIKNSLLNKLHELLEKY